MQTREEYEAEFKSLIKGAKERFGKENWSAAAAMGLLILLKSKDILLDIRELLMNEKANNSEQTKNQHK